MRLIDNQHGTMTFRNACHFTKRRHVAVHAEHAFRDDDRPPVARTLQRCFERIQILMRINNGPRFCQPDAIDEARVIALVRYDEVAIRHNGLKQSDIGGITRSEE